MFVRLLFLLLLALNFGAAAWLFIAPQPQARAFAPTDSGVAELVLLSERDRGSEASAAELASAP
ncbi:MAG TPA: SPOR domain-containing protein, partial [Rudaea sp.]|nr:SPOR domain-containing protein [Rudaea sp.]